MPATLDIKLSENDGGWIAHVTVAEGASKSMHRVTVPNHAYEDLTAGKVAPDELLRASFEFLLEREPKESILREFDLMTIQRYFPEYKSEMKKRFGAAG